eukprot:6209727-Pleurochrysis_carterae.AAC.3
MSSADAVVAAAFVASRVPRPHTAVSERHVSKDVRLARVVPLKAGALDVPHDGRALLPGVTAVAIAVQLGVGASAAGDEHLLHKHLAQEARRALDVVRLVARNVGSTAPVELRVCHNHRGGVVAPAASVALRARYADAVPAARLRRLDGARVVQPVVVRPPGIVDELVRVWIRVPQRAAN